MTDHSAAQPSDFLAAVFHGPQHPFELCRFPRPELLSGEAIVQVECCTLCGSDLHTVAARRSGLTPTILGHEILGVVEQVSDTPPVDLQGVPLAVGDRITWSVCVSCGQCDRCRGGLPQKCRQLSKYGHDVAQGRGALSGGLAEAILLRANSAVVKVPRELPDEVACPANCATATVMAAFQAMGPVEGMRVLIVGAGLLGLTATAVAKSRGAESITVCDPMPERLRLAERFGADRTEVSSHFDVVLDFSGSTDAIEKALEVADVGARIVLVGSVMSSDDLRLNPEQVVRQCWQIHGIHNYAPADLFSAVEFLRQYHQTFPFTELVSATFPLSQIDAAIRFADAHRPVRIAMRPRIDAP